MAGLVNEVGAAGVVGPGRASRFPLARSLLAQVLRDLWSAVPWAVFLAFGAGVFVAGPRIPGAARRLGAAAAEEVRLAVTPADSLARQVGELQRQVAGLEGASRRLQQAAAQRAPKETYIVVDMATNRLLVRGADGEVSREAVCSTGSGQELVAPDGRRWVFNTPRGVFRVRTKVEVPVWIKPDWAFFEEGKKPPGARSEERYEEGVLGEYALGLGDGYLIHGTLYKRQLGKSVTHGCVRLDDADLEYTYNQARIGTPVYIF